MKYRIVGRSEDGRDGTTVVVKARSRAAAEAAFHASNVIPLTIRSCERVPGDTEHEVDS